MYINLRIHLLFEKALKKLILYESFIYPNTMKIQ